MAYWIVNFLFELIKYYFVDFISFEEIFKLLFEGILIFETFCCSFRTPSSLKSDLLLKTHFVDQLKLALLKKQ